jgi:hypothetical protein
VPWLVICSGVLLVAYSRLALDTEGTALRTLTGSAAQMMLCIGLVLPLPRLHGLARVGSLATGKLRRVRLRLPMPPAGLPMPPGGRSALAPDRPLPVPPEGRI